MEQPCLVRLQKIGTSSNGKAYAKGVLEDNSGSVPFICFEAGPISRLRSLTAPSPAKSQGRWISTNIPTRWVFRSSSTR